MRHLQGLLSPKGIEQDLLEFVHLLSLEPFEDIYLLDLALLQGTIALQ